MSRVVVSEGYRSVLSLYDTQEAIALIKKTFEKSHFLYIIGLYM